MAVKARRIWRARLLRGLEWTLARSPAMLRDSLLDGAAGLARFTRYEQRTLANLERVYGTELDLAGRQSLARAVRRHAALQVGNWLELSRIRPDQRSSGEWIERRVRLDASFERLERERRAGRGLLIVTAHLGDWELLCARLARAGFPGAVVGYQRRNDPASAFLPRMRRAYGVQTLDQSEPPRRALEILQRGEVLGLVTDLAVVRLRGEVLPFLGQPAWTIRAPAALARASGLPLMPVRCVRERGTGDFVLSVEEGLALDPALPPGKRISDLLRRQNEVFGRWIRATPEQWAWHQERWKPAPPLPHLDQILEGS
ncbi:MAG: lysophospholipid acyltransferase family protein [Planctomycetia bacterium]